jgi:hypothetical protein
VRVGPRHADAHWRVSMDARVRRVRDESDSRTKGRHYSSTSRRDAVSVARERLGQGGFLADIARELTVPIGSLRRWLASAPAAFRAVDIVADPAARAAPMVDHLRLMIQTARGHRLEGLDLATAITVLRALEATA